jgi:hypothetical protein
MVPKLAAKGSSFKGAAAYYLHDKGASTSERVAWTATVNLATENPEAAWRIMVATAKDQARLKEQAGIRNTGRKSADVVLAYSLAWHPDEKDGLTREEMLLAAHASIKALGAEHCQALIVAHQDEPHPHVHVILNRVSPEDGRMLSSSKEKLNLSKWAEAYERGRGRIFCEERVANNQARDVLKEFTRAAKDRPRHLHDQEKDGGKARPGESYRVTRIREDQKAKDAALAAKGREMHQQHRQQWDDLRDQHRSRREGVTARAKSVIGQMRADMRAANLPQWRQMHKRHFAEQRLFKDRESRVTGKIQNAIAAIKSMGAVRGDASARGFLGNAFNYLTSAAKREAALVKRQDAEKRSFAALQRREIKAKTATIRADQKQQQVSNRHRLGEAVKALRAAQERDRQTLRNEWRQRNSERREAWSKINASRDLRRQVAERFASRDRSGGPDRGR